MLKAPIFLYNTFHKGFAAGHVGCQIFAFVGSLSGIGAGMTNAFIAYDRCSTITCPFERKLTKTKAFVMILFIWCYTIPWAVLPLLEIWSRFVPGILNIITIYLLFINFNFLIAVFLEGYLTSCSFDYLTDTFDNHLFVATIFVCSYVIPLIMIIYYYTQIVNQVFKHEKALREQVN